MRNGIPVSPGVAVGTAYRIDEVFVNPDTKRLEPGQVQAELARYERARAKTADDLRSLKQKVARQVGPHEAAIFASHLAILEDPAFDSKTRAWIAEHHETAQAALHHLMNEYASMFARTRDEYLKLRLNDLRDVVLRISGHLSEVLQPDGKTLPGPLIVVADELLPSHVVALGDRPVMGIVTQAGGQTSHAAILARSRGIPAVSGMRGILKQVETGDRIVVDGTTGNVVVNPDSETESAYRKLQREFVDLKDQLAANRDQPARSADGETVQLLANINGIAGVKAATAMGATGIGLYRTEYLYLTHPDVPDEEEQFQAYRDVIAASPGNTVTIRTLDIGGDKTVPYLGHAREANPFMGWRSIRLSFEHPELFSTQIRAILRAAAAERCAGRTVRMLFPMVTTFEEMRRLRTLVDRARRQLESRRIRVGPVPVGLMLEVPAAAVSIRSLLPTVDFVSIGSNDLVQYLMAADRDNPKVSHLCQPLSPPVIRVLTDVIAACNAAHKPVTLCGEMAGSPKGFLLLFGMGLRSFSMSPAFIPSMKELLSHLTVANAESIHRRLLLFKAISQVSRYLGEQVKKLAPSLSRLDTG
jgi:phosphotransferase system enzyme I (PtsI)